MAKVFGDRKNQALAALSLLAICLIFAVATLPAIAQGINTGIKEALKEQPGDTDVVAVVDGAPVLRGDVRLATLAVDANRPGLSKAERPKAIIKLAARTYLEVAEAERRGIQVTREEAQAYTDQMHRLSTQMDSEGRDILAEVIKSSRLTEEEYWKNQVDNYARALAIIKLREQVKAEVASASPDDQERHYEAFIDGLLSKATIEYKDKTLE